jgi:hypothetical protein
MTANTLALLLLAALALFLLVTNLSIRNRARGAVSSRDTLDNEAFSRRYFAGREARLASGVRAALAAYIPGDVSRVYPDDDLVKDLQLGAIEGKSADDFIASLERLYNIEIPPPEARALRTLWHLIGYISRKSQAAEAGNAARPPL